MTHTIAEIKATNKAAGQHFFEAGTMRFFKSRILPTVYGGRYFVTAETGPSDVERFSVREAIDGGAKINTVGAFNRMSKADAQDLARAMARSGQDAERINEALKEIRI